ncbi:XF1762 family protein [Nonomuraea spiralis]|uniref:XF1762 family protein n=1 Tax=Nonomuraea spiralis TaxID=46182 RepID=A0ABV5J002_9ACTN|nr:hypothetical protein GCM10010176_100430 [Nonomuraea spiralis]
MWTTSGRRSRAGSTFRVGVGEAEQNPERRGNPQLVVSPVTIRTARAFVAWAHRRLGPPPGAKFAIAVQTTDGTLVGVVLVGRPVARAFDDGRTAEVTRPATDGTPTPAPRCWAPPGGAPARRATAG